MTGLGRASAVWTSPSREWHKTAIAPPLERAATRNFNRMGYAVETLWFCVVSNSGFGGRHGRRPGPCLLRAAAGDRRRLHRTPGRADLQRRLGDDRPRELDRGGAAVRRSRAPASLFDLGAPRAADERLLLLYGQPLRRSGADFVQLHPAASRQPGRALCLLSEG